MAHVFSTTQRLLGYIPEDEVWQMTPKHWNTLIKGARHRMIDLQEIQITGAVAMARMNNGKEIRSMMRELNEKRALIDQSQSERDYQKRVKKQKNKHIRRKQVADMNAWLEKVNEKR